MNKPASELIALAANCPELNMSNYNESDVEELNNWAIEIATTIDRTVANQSGSERAGSMAAQWTYDPDAETYYFAPMQAAAPPYLKQRHVEAIIDIAADGTLAGVELIDNMPPPPALATPPAQPAPASGESSTSSDGTLPLYETAGGFPVAAAPYQAEETGVIQSTRQGAGVERGMDQCVTGGESAATPSTHGKPDGAVREAVCCSAISPCEYQRTHRTGVCETCQKAAALSPKIATAETSPGDVIAMKEVLGHIRTAILEARLEVVTDTEYSEGFYDAQCGDPLFDDATDPYRAGWEAFYVCKEIMDHNGFSRTADGSFEKSFTIGRALQQSQSQSQEGK